MTIARSSITGRFISKLTAMLSPDTTVMETRRPQFTYEELSLARDALDAFVVGVPKQDARKAKLLAKIDRMLG